MKKYKTEEDSGYLIQLINDHFALPNSRPLQSGLEVKADNKPADYRINPFNEKDQDTAWGGFLENLYRAEKLSILKGLTYFMFSFLQEPMLENEDKELIIMVSSKISLMNFAQWMILRMWFTLHSDKEDFEQNYKNSISHEDLYGNMIQDYLIAFNNHNPASNIAHLLTNRYNFVCEPWNFEFKENQKKTADISSGDDKKNEGLVTLTKSKKSDKKDEKSANIVNLSVKFRGHDTVVFEHVAQRDLIKPRKERYAHGGSSIVKKVFSLPEKQLIGVVKILERESFFNKEIKYQKLLGREIVYGQRNRKFYIFMPYYQVSLSEYNYQLKKYFIENKPMTLPIFDIKTRAKLFIDYFKQVELIHNRKECVGDPKTTNCMLDWDAKNPAGTVRLHMIDFDGVHQTGLDEPWLHTQICLPPNLIGKDGKTILMEYTQADDIFILGHMLADCFPEIFSVKFDPEDLKVAAEVSFHPHLQPLQQDKFNLLSKMIEMMMFPSKNYRLSIEQCLQNLSYFEKYISGQEDKEIEKKPEGSLGRELPPSVESLDLNFSGIELGKNLPGLFPPVQERSAQPPAVQKLSGYGIK